MLSNLETIQLDEKNSEDSQIGCPIFLSEEFYINARGNW